jgi:WD40 repeat protein
MSGVGRYAKLLDADERLSHARSAGDGPFAVGFLRDSLLSHPDDPRPQDRLDEVGLRFVEPTLGGHADNVTAVAWTPGGELIVTGSEDGRVKVWDGSTGTELWTAAGLSTTVNAVAVSPSGALLAAGTGAGELALCRLDEPGAPFVLTEPGDCVCCLAFTASGARLGAGCREGSVRVYKVDEGAAPLEPSHQLGGHPGRVEGLAWLPEGGGLVTLTSGGTLRLYVGPLGSPPEQYSMFPEGGDGLAITTGGVLCAWSAVGAEFRLWQTGGEWQRLKDTGARNDVLKALALRPDGGQVFAALDAGGLVFWDVEQGEVAGRLRSVRPVRCAAFSPDGTRIALGLAVSNYLPAGADLGGVSGGGFVVQRGDRTTPDIRGLKEPLIVIDPQLEGRPLGPAPGFGSVQQLAFSPDGQRLACALYQSRKPKEKCVRVFGVDDRREVLACEHTTFVSGVAWSPDGKRLAASSIDQFVRVWSSALTGDELAHLESPLGREARAWAVAFTPDGAHLLVACEDERLRLLDPLTGAVAVTFGAGLEAPAHFIGMSRDGSRVAAGAPANNRVLVWRADRPEEPVARVQHGHGDLLALALSPAGDRLATARKGEGVVRLWDAATGAAAGELTGHAGCARALAFSPDGALLASAADDGAVRLWAMDRCEERRCVRVTSSRPQAVAFSPDGRLLAIGAHEIALLTVR